MSIYVEIRIRGQSDELWERTQNPDFHERWDMRFTSIKYLSRADESEPQRFLYATRIGFGLAVHGEGETVGTHDKSLGLRTSSLQFWSDDPKSLIVEGLATGSTFRSTMASALSPPMTIEHDSAR